MEPRLRPYASERHVHRARDPEVGVFKFLLLEKGRIVAEGMCDLYPEIILGTVIGRRNVENSCHVITDDIADEEGEIVHEHW